MAFRIGDLLLSEKLITEEQLNEALRKQKLSGKGRIGENLIELGYVTEKDIARVLGKQYDCPYLDLTDYKIDQRCLSLIPSDMATKYQVVPIHRDGKTLTVVISNPNNKKVIEELKFTTGFDISPVVSSEMGIKKAIKKYYGKIVPETAFVTSETSAVESATISPIKETNISAGTTDKLINELLQDAINKRANCIHIEPFEGKARVRLRIDGVLYETISIPFANKESLISQLKAKSGTASKGKETPSLGRFEIEIDNKKLVILLLTIPTMYGEKAELKIKNKETAVFELEQLGLDTKGYREVLKAIESRYGMILVSGPGKSGKTSTMYSLIQKLNQTSSNIVAIEDPPELNLPGVNQVLINKQIGFNTAKAIESIRNSDAEVVMIGNLDDENAKIATQLALRSLVITYLEAGNTIEAIMHLLDKGVTPISVASAINCVIGKRLLRKLCDSCKSVLKTDTKESKTVFYEAKGCSECNYTGYKGQVPLYEVMPISPAIRELITTNASPNSIRNKAIEEGMITLRVNALMKLRDGLVSLDEVKKEIQRELAEGEKGK
jgi:type IV pilus assembly protein PilB